MSSSSVILFTLARQPPGGWRNIGRGIIGRRMIGRGDDWSLGLLVAGIIGRRIIGRHFFMCKKCVCYVDLSVADVRCLIVHRKNKSKSAWTCKG